MPSPRRKQRSAPVPENESALARSMWSGTITFGLVSIPVDLLSAVQPRRTAMKLVDKAGHPLGRQYHCSKEDKKLNYDDLVRGYETEDGEMIVITDEEFEAAAPEMSADIELRNFVPLQQIPALYFQRPYFLAPAGKSVKAYHLLAATMQRTERVGIGSFVMRGHEYLVAIISDNGVLRVDTLRYADEIRTPQSIGLPKRKKAHTGKVTQFAKAIDDLVRDELDTAELRDEEADALRKLAEAKQKRGDDVIRVSGADTEDAEAGGGAQVIDLMEVLRKSLSKSTIVTNAEGATPISLAERRAQRARQAAPSKQKPATSRKAKAPRKTRRKRAR